MGVWLKSWNSSVSHREPNLLITRTRIIISNTFIRLVLALWDVRLRLTCKIRLNCIRFNWIKLNYIILSYVGIISDQTIINYIWMKLNKF